MRWVWSEMLVVRAAGAGLQLGDYDRGLPNPRRLPLQRGDTDLEKLTIEVGRA